MTAITHGYANVNGIRLHYAESGSGDNLVILLHGFPEFWYSWRHQLSALAQRFRVVALDMRGYNLSDKPSRVEDYRIEVLADDVLGIIEHFGSDRAAIVGHDWGASVAWAVARRHPERVSRLAIMQVPPPAAWRVNMTLRQLLRSWYMFFFLLPRIPEWAISRKNFSSLDRAFEAAMTKQPIFDTDEIRAYKEAMAVPGAMTAAVNYYRANVRRMMTRVGRRLPRARLSGGRSDRIRVPTLFIFGEQDRAILPATVRGVEKYIDAPYREVRIADSGHWVQNEAVNQVNEALLDFLAPLTVQQS